MKYVRPSSVGGGRYVIEDEPDWDPEQWGLIAAFLTPAVWGSVLYMKAFNTHFFQQGILPWVFGGMVVGYLTRRWQSFWTLAGILTVGAFFMWSVGFGMLDYLLHGRGN